MGGEEREDGGGMKCTGVESFNLLLYSRLRGVCRVLYDYYTIIIIIIINRRQSGGQWCR